MGDTGSVNPNIKYCPPEVQAHPLPHDECSAPEPEWTSPGERYRHLSIFTDWTYNFQAKNFKNLGLGFIFRPFDKTTTGFWGFGAGWETNFEDRWSALGRIQSSFNIQRNGRDRLTLAALGGVQHQESIGILGQVGLETSLEWRVVTDPFHATVNFPLISARYTLPNSSSDNDSQESLWNLFLGIRGNLDFLPGGI